MEEILYLEDLLDSPPATHHPGNEPRGLYYLPRTEGIALPRIASLAAARKRQQVEGDVDTVVVVVVEQSMARGNDAEEEVKERRGKQKRTLRFVSKSLRFF